MLGLTDPSIFYENLKQRLSERVNPNHVDSIERLGLLDETPVMKLNTPIDTLSNYLSKRLAFGKLCFNLGQQFTFHVNKSLKLKSFFEISR